MRGEGSWWRMVLVDSIQAQLFEMDFIRLH